MLAAFAELRFLFFPVLRRGSEDKIVKNEEWCFYSSPSCDGDQSDPDYIRQLEGFYSSPSCDGDRVWKKNVSSRIVSILPRLATGISSIIVIHPFNSFLFFPVLRRGSYNDCPDQATLQVSILPRLATGI